MVCDGRSTYRAPPPQFADAGDHGARAGPPDERVAYGEDGCHLARGVFLVEEQYGTGHERPAPPRRGLFVGNGPGDVDQSLTMPVDHVRERVVVVESSTGPCRVGDLPDEHH